MKKKLSRLAMDINKFSFSQMTSNTSGKTSGSGTMGLLICVVGSLCFLLGCIDKLFINKDADIVMQSIVFVGIGAALLGYRKSKGSILPETPEMDAQKEQEEPICTCADDCLEPECKRCKRCNRCQKK